MNASRIVGLFLAFGVAWILISDRILEFLIQDPHARQTAQSVKGVVFVLASAVLIYVLVRQAERERARLEAETLREKNRLARVLEVAPAVIYSLKADPGGQGFVTDFVSDQIEPMMGYSVDQWMAHPDFWRQHVHPDDLAGVDKAQHTLFESGRVQHEYRFQHADGAYRWVNDRLILQRDAAGLPTQIHGAWLDISERKRVELVMIEADKRYRNLFRQNPQPMWIYDEETLKFISVNEAAISKYGYSRDEFLAMTVLDIRPPEDVARFQAMLTDHEASGNSQLFGGVWRHRKKDGTLFWVEIAGHSLEFYGLKARLILLTDVTDRYQAEERLRLISHVFDASQEGISITDANNRYVSVNRAFTRITGYAPEEVIGKTPAVQKSGRHDKAFYERMWQQLREEGHWEGEVWNRRKSGEIYPQWLIITVIKDTQGQVQQYMGIFMDSTGRKAAEERIQRLANYDILTGLPNRTLLFDRAKVAFATAGRTHAPVVVMHLNVDHFKHINESLGHEVGDEVLVTLSQRLLTALRPEDTVSRLGGDDFIILLPHITARDVATVAMRLMAAVAEPLTVADQEVRLTASVGIAEFPDNGADLVQLTQAAESAVSQAKREGRNTFRFFSRSVQDQVKETLVMERDLRLAVERHQLVLHYQPQLDVASGRLVGMEALVRWQHPEWGLVPPGRFIPVAEASGLIREIGQWVLDTALQQNANWAAAGLAIVPVAVNLSMAQFKDPGLRDAVIEALQLSGLPPAMVELELTESVAMEDSDFTIATIDGLKRLGVALSIDDFGTGYSSLSYLKRFDIDKLKIDQSFVRGLKFDPQDEVIAATVINLAHSLGLRTIAEGVETQDQLDFLRAHGCDQYQGYFFSRPVPADEVVKYLQPIEAAVPSSP